MDARLLRRIVPMLHVADCERSIAFYRKLGFDVSNTVEHEGRIGWAWLDNGDTALMVASADEAIDPEGQGALLYLYADDVADLHTELTEHGLPIGPIETPFYAPQGEFRIVDPDGYVLMFTHYD